MARVLVVDDKPHITHVIASWLKTKGHDVSRADDGDTALELLRTETFDILVTDVDMPRMDGLSLIAHQDVVERLRGIVVLTGRDDYADLIATFSREKTRLLPKPFSPTRLTQLVDKLMSGETVIAS